MPAGADDEPDETDETGDGASGSGANDDDTDAGASGSDTGKDIKDPEKKRLSDEAAARRREARQAQKERDDLAAKLRKYEDADKSEVEKLGRDLKEASERADRAEAALREKALRLSFYDSGAADLFGKPSHALKLLDLSTLEADEDGEYDLKAIKKAAEDFLKENPLYARENTSGADDDQPSSGRPMNGQKKTGKEASIDALKKKFPALQGR